MKEARRALDAAAKGQASFGRTAASLGLRLAARAARLPFGGRKRRRVWKGFTVFFILLALMLPRGDTLSLSPPQSAGAEYRFDIIGWEVANFPAKWVRRALDFLPWSGSSPDTKRAKLARHLELSESIARVGGELERLVAGSGSDEEELSELEAEMDRMVDERRNLRDDVEELLEATVSTIVAELGLALAGPLIWPPVDVRLDATPHVLVTSPRDRIHRLDSVLLDTDVPVRAMEEMERRLLERADLSAIVIQVGGVATYPAVIPPGGELERLLELTAHEWLHMHLFFHPFGQALFGDNDMFTLNETLANLFAREVTPAAYERLTGLPPPKPMTSAGEAELPEAGEFDFDRFMHETRRRVDELLADGDIEGAEAFMEARRVEINSNGFHIRKINQAWFAFQGTYASSPASVSTIDTELEDLRGYVLGLGDVVRMLHGISSYDEFLAVLERARAGAAG